MSSLYRQLRLWQAIAFMQLLLLTICVLRHL